MGRRLAIVSAVVFLVATACGSSKSSTSGKQPSATQAPSGPMTVGVQVDGKTPSFNGTFTAYFPNEVKVHPGDTVSFKSNFTGEPHTVTMGTLVDTGLPKALAAGPNATDEPPELKKIPDLLPRGPGDASQTSGQPCFLASGDPPTGDAACAKAQQIQPDFDGTQTYYNSGFLPDQATFVVKLSKNIKPGTYNYFCALHREGMTGKITVVAENQSVPGPDQVTTDGQNQLNGIAQKLQPVATGLKGGTLPPFVTTAKVGQALAGGGTQDVDNGGIDEFGPPSITVPVGGSVTWTVIGAHTISFNAPASAQNVIAKAPDGSVHANPAALAPQGGPGQPPPPQGPPPSTAPNAPPPPPTVVDGGNWDGTGFHSSGFFLSFPPQLYAYQLTFTKAGTYNYVCLVHPDMKGSIKVG